MPKRADRRFTALRRCAVPKWQSGVLKRITLGASTIGHFAASARLSRLGTLLALRRPTTTMTDPTQVAILTSRADPQASRRERRGIGLIIAVRLLEVLIIFVLWLVMR